MFIMDALRGACAAFFTTKFVFFTGAAVLRIMLRGMILCSKIRQALGRLKSRARKPICVGHSHLS